MREYAESALEDLHKGLAAGKELTAMMDNAELYLDVLTDIFSHAAHQNLHFENAKERNTTLRAWTRDFVDRYAGMDWSKVDYNVLVGEYAVEKVNGLRMLNMKNQGQ